MYERKWKRTFTPAVAMQNRKEIALRNAGVTPEGLVKSISSTVLCNIRTYLSAENILPGNETEFVNFMRKHGGYAGFIQTVIGPAPAAEANRIGMATSDAYWLWTVKDELREQIRFAVQSSLHDELMEVSA